MSLFLSNKQLGFGITLEEIKRMTPQEAYILGQQLMTNIKAIEAERLKHGI